MFAIVQTGGKQYLVREGDALRVEKLSGKEGSVFNLDALLVADDEGQAVKIGAPLVSGAKVAAKIVAQGRAEKILVVKYKPKSRYKRNVGHRQPYTEIKIESIKA